jgi:3-hydroxyisobutyrate dehydrogenase-like beta-hydroxyacid dehydrogenase
VLSATDGLLAGANPGTTVVLLSTVAVPVVHELAATCAKAGVSLLDCGVTPGDKAADNGMVAILGGDHDTVVHAMPVLADFAKEVVHCGPLGAGMATKIARNLITYGSWTVVSEAAGLARAAGVDPAVLLRVIDAADPAGTTLLSWLRNQIADTDEIRALVPQVRSLLDKDLAAAEELAGHLGVPMPVATLARANGPHTLAFGDADGER